MITNASPTCPPDGRQESFLAAACRSNIQTRMGCRIDSSIENSPAGDVAWNDELLVSRPENDPSSRNGVFSRTATFKNSNGVVRCPQQPKTFSARANPIRLQSFPGTDVEDVQVRGVATRLPGPHD